MKTFSTSLAFCAGNSPVTGEFPTQRPVTRSFDVFLYQRVNQHLSKQWRDWWFETPSCSLWRHCNVKRWITSYPVRRLLACRRMSAMASQYNSSVIMSAMASQTTGVSTFCSTVCSGAAQRKHQISASVGLWGEFTVHRWIPRSVGQ